MNNPTQLIPLVEKAYGQPISVEFDNLNKAIVDERNFERRETKSLYEIGAELDAEGWKAFDNSFQDTLKKLEAGEVKAGSADFYAMGAKLKQEAIAIKNAQDSVKEIREAMLKNPGKVGFKGTMTLDNGEVIEYNQGMDGFANRIQGIKDKKPRNGFEYAEDLSKAANDVTVRELTPQEANKKMTDQAKALNEVLLKSKGTGEPKVRNIGYGKVKITTTSSIDDKYWEAALNKMKIDHGDDLKFDYNNEVAAGRINPKELSLDDYKTQRIVPLLIKGTQEDVSIQNDNTPKADKDNDSGKSWGNGSMQNGRFFFKTVNVVSDRRKRSATTGEKTAMDKNLKNRVDVTSLDNSEPIKTFENNNGEGINGKLSNILQDPFTGAVSLQIQTAKDSYEEVPLEPNIGTIEEFYEIDMNDINRLTESLGNQQGGSTNSPIKGYSIQEIEEVATQAGMTVEEYVKWYNDTQRNE